MNKYCKEDYGGHCLSFMIGCLTNTLHHEEDGEDDIDYQRLYWSREEIEELCTDYPWLKSFSTGLFTPFKLDCKNGCVID